MNPLLRRRLLSGALAPAALGLAFPAGAVVILDSTWRAEGGRPGRESAGFGAHVALAHQPQFASVMALSEDDGESWDDASGTWIGNMAGPDKVVRGVVLTSGHNFEPGEGADNYLYRTGGGTVRRGVRLDSHPLFNRNHQERSGYDAAIVRLDGPVTDAGPAPALYAGRDEEGQQIVMVGYGTRGIGSVGEDGKYNTPGQRAAATNVINDVMDAVVPPPPSGDAGNWLEITLRRESEGADRLDGLLGSGDSGGSAWMRTGRGWVIVGINANGTGKTTYGENSEFARVSGLRDWILRLAPVARFVG
ncbi:MAG: trypsin-like serine protease [Reyranella sp.]|nr:trypsin-like serine protease [Reyranella sp.]